VVEQDPICLNVRLISHQQLSGEDTGDAKSLREKTRFLVKAANLPASTLSVIDIPFRGRNLKIAGDRTFDPWTITVINDTDFRIRNAFEKWMNYINKHEDNSGQTDPVILSTKYEGTTNLVELRLGSRYAI
jgi:hypothetical protein